MRRGRAEGSESGSAVIEFLLVGVLLSLPVFYLVLTLARLQAGTYAVTAAARESARTYIAAQTPGGGQQRATAAARLAFQDQGFGEQGEVRIVCGGVCLARGSSVTSEARLAVDLPLIPDFLRGALPSSISVSATHSETVGRFKR